MSSRTSRKTWVNIEGEKFSLEEYFKRICEKETVLVSYRCFYQRVKTIQKNKCVLTCDLLQILAMKDKIDLISLSGQKRKSEFLYDGDDYPEHFGKLFPSLTSFLNIIGKNNIYQRVKGRIRKGWPIDIALKHEPIDYLDPVGKIYCISTHETDKKYVGLTTTDILVRMAQHISRYNAIYTPANNNTLLHGAFHEYGVENFTISLLEDNVPIQQLGERERHWIAQLNTLHPNGLNRLTGGQIGGGRLKETVFDGQVFPSVKACNYHLASKLNMPEHVIDQRLRQGKPLPQNSRKHSTHPEAGSELWRQWKSLLNRMKDDNDSVCDEWKNIPDGYEAFKSAAGQRPSKCHRLYRIDDTFSWRPNNVEWLPLEDGIAKIHGKLYLLEVKSIKLLKDLPRQAV